MRKHSSIFYLMFYCSLSACSVGVNFTKPADDKVKINTTTKDEIITMLGQASSVSTIEDDGIVIETLRYVYGSMDGLDKAVRSVNYGFYKNILIGKCYTSTYEADSTNFDIEKSKIVKKGVSFGEVVAELGQPKCEYIYPATEKESYKGFTYSFWKFSKNGSENKSIILEVDENNIVQSVKKISETSKF